MLFYLSKILPALLLPTIVTIVLAVAGLVLRRRSMIIAAVALLWICSTPGIAGWLERTNEGGAVRAPAADAPVTDGIVVLSIGRSMAPGPAAISEWEDADRFFAGVELFRAGKAPLLIFTGGTVPGASSPLEGEVLREQAVAMGVPRGHVVSVGRVVNTADEADAVSRFLAARTEKRARVLLVTSAFHMPRAGRLFEQAGLEVARFPVDFQGPTQLFGSVLDWVPTARALARSEGALREMYGRLYYSVF